MKFFKEHFSSLPTDYSMQSSNNFSFFSNVLGKKLVFDAGAPQCTCTFCGVNVDKTNLRCLQTPFLYGVLSVQEKRDRAVRLVSAAPWGGIWNTFVLAPHREITHFFFVPGCLSHHMVHWCSLSRSFLLFFLCSSENSSRRTPITTQRNSPNGSTGMNMWTCYGRYGCFSGMGPEFLSLIFYVLLFFPCPFLAYAERE